MDLNNVHKLMDSVHEEFGIFIDDVQTFLDEYRSHEPTLSRMKHYYKRGVVLKERARDLNAHLSLLSNETKLNHIQLDTIIKQTSEAILDSIRDE
jgi:dsRNA-specific ribonuclease